MTHETTQQCAYATARLVVGDWHRMSHRYGLDLIDAICSVLTRITTAALPPEWQGDFDDQRAKRWVEARDAESPTMLVVTRDDSKAVGLLILFESASQQDPDRIDVRLGYVLAESAWGKGLASELVQGLVDWASAEPSIRSISGGVARDNDASARVLLNNGFKPSGDATNEAETYEIILGHHH